MSHGVSNSQNCIIISVEVFFCINTSGIEIGIFWEKKFNTMPADVLVPCIVSIW